MMRLLRAKPVETAALVGYLAGIIDGEGSIYRKGRAKGAPIVPGRWVVCVTNTDRRLLDWLESLGGIVRPKVRREGQREAWEWLVLAKNDQVMLLTAVLPYLRVKDERAREALGELLALERAA